MAIWRDYLAQAGPGQHTVMGNLQVLPDLRSPQLENNRDVLVYLPPSYAARPDRRYPVIYMQDGQNLFDAAASHAGEWQVDETLETLSREALEAIAVGVSNMGNQRVAEYTPFRDPIAGGGLGDAYLSFVVETVKPLIDGEFRTLPDREHTGILGSSLGGLISLYAIFRHPTVFGLVGALSPSLAYHNRAMFEYVADAAMPGGRIYLDVGTREAGNLAATGRDHDDWSEAYLRNVRDMHRLLVACGYRDGADLRYVEEPGGIHHESAWARRLPGALRFLLP